MWVNGPVRVAQRGNTTKQGTRVDRLQVYFAF